MTSRDLGAALRDLPVPDHRPEFFAELEARLQAETAAPLPFTTQPARPRWRGWQLTMAVATAVAMVLAVAATARLVGNSHGATNRVRLVPAGPRPPAVPPVQVARGEMRDEGGGGPALVHTFVYASDGRFRYDVGDGSVVLSEQGRFVQRDADG